MNPTVWQAIRTPFILLLCSFAGLIAGLVASFYFGTWGHQGPSDVPGLMGFMVAMSCGLFTMVCAIFVVVRIVSFRKRSTTPG